MRQILMAMGLLVLAGCATTESDRFLHEMERQERMEQAAAEQAMCESQANGAWMCTSPSKRANERYPWLYCSCVSNRGAF